MIPKEEDYNWALIIIPFFPSRNTFFSGKEVECMSTYGAVDLTQTLQQHQHILCPIHFSPFSSPQKEGNRIMCSIPLVPSPFLELREEQQTLTTTQKRKRQKKFKFTPMKPSGKWEIVLFRLRISKTRPIKYIFPL